MKAAAKLIICILCMVSLTSCEKWFGKSGRYENLLVVYSAGFNNLSNSLKDDISDIEKGTYIPGRKSKDALVVVNHSTVSGGYSKATEPVVINIHKDKKGIVVRDTIRRFESGTTLADAAVMRRVLSYVSETFPASHSSLLFSSHGTGWVPEGYYDYPYEYRNDKKPSSIGSEVNPQKTSENFEMSLTDFAGGIPVHFDCIYFDACLMGCVEVAYELKDVTDMIAFSPAEILTDGFDYKTLAMNVLGLKSPQKVCSDYFEQYDKRAGEYRSATISLVDCSKLNALAGVCKDLFEKYRNEIGEVDHRDIQRYYRPSMTRIDGIWTSISHQWYFDLEDILIQSGASKADIDRLTAAVKACVTYKACTDAFLKENNGFELTHYSGLSMYLPCAGSIYLDDCYKTLAWNKATALVK